MPVPLFGLLPFLCFFLLFLDPLFFFLQHNLHNFLCRQPQKGENFVAQQIARDIEKEFLFKQAQLDLKKYEQVHSAVLKIKNMYEKSVEESQKN